MLEPILQNIHIPLQPFKRMSLKLPRLSLLTEKYLKIAKDLEMDLRRCVIVEKGVYKFTNLITGRKRFSVPIYQRHYAWELKQWNDLYCLELPKTHYFGQVILMEKPSQSQYGLWFEEYEVVDGQQRLATILILLKELLKALEERGALPTEELARLKEDYLRFW